MGVQTCALPIFASSFGWRWAFVSVALFGLFMGVLYPLVVTNKRLGISKASADSQLAPGRARIDFRELATWLFKGRTIILPYIGRSAERSVGQVCVSMCRSRWSPFN